MIKLLEVERSVGEGELGFVEKDVRNLIQSVKKCDKDGEDLVRICEGVKERDPDFRFDCAVDCMGRLEHIAWACNSSVELYEMFGDAVVFDASRKLEGFGDMVLGIWIGMDSCGEMCSFGGVLLRAESLRFMNGKSPQTILTDQNTCLKEAIQNEMPNSKHAFCIWSIITKLPSWFSAILGDRYSDFKAEFYRLYNSESTEEFELGWQEMVENYGFCMNRHISDLFAFRSFWALPYFRNHFFAGCHAPGVVKSVNAFIQRFLSSQTRLRHSIEQITTQQNPTAQTLQTISFKTGSPIESHAVLHLTPYTFAELQDELVLSAHFAAFRTDESSFLVRRHTESRTVPGRIVTWAPHREMLSCSCGMFEFCGILCRHALRVLSTSNCFQIPYRFLPVRWRRQAHASEPVRNEPGSDEVAALQSVVSDLLSEAVKSKECTEFVAKEVQGVLARVRERNGKGVV